MEELAVKKELVDTEDVGSASAVKRELDMGPPIDKQHVPRLRKPEPVEEQPAGASQRDSKTMTQWNVDWSAYTRAFIRSLRIGNKCSALRAVLDHHINPDSGESYHCEYCLMSFNLKSRLEVHMKTHFQGKPHRSNDSRKECKSQSNSKRISIIDTGGKGHSCVICRKMFTKTSNLKRHIMTHTGQKPYHCDICKKAFINKSDLKIHTISHTGELPHHCKLCEKAFKTSWLLKRHVMSHTGERTHHCNICKKAFIRNSHLKTHMKIHTGEKSSL